MSNCSLARLYWIWEIELLRCVPLLVWMVFMSNDLSVLCKVAFLLQVLRLLNEHCGKEYSVHLCDEW